MAFMDLPERVANMSDCQEVVDEKCRFLKDSGTKFNERSKEKRRRCSISSEGTQETMPPRIGGVRDRRRLEREPGMGQFIRDTAGATHALSYVVK